MITNPYIITGCNEVVAKVMSLLVSVILSTGGVCLSACWDTATPPKKEAPPAKETPLPIRPPCQETPLPRRPPQEGGTPCQRIPPKETSKKEAPCQGDPLEGEPPKKKAPPPKKEEPPTKETPPKKEGPPPGPHPRGKLRGIRSRPTPKGEIDGDQIQAHTQGGN